ncbi:MAG: hypothetical protein RL467_81 [Actinomycetota bacterium]
MTSQKWSFDQPDRFIVGTIGAPGEREFYFQIRQKNILVSLATEKSQATALAERISTIIREIKKSAPLSAVNPGPADDQPLELPLDSEFVVGAIGIAFDPASLEIEVSFRAEDSDSLGDEADDDSGPLVEIHLDLSMALAFAQRTMALVAAGRPLCPFCISPIDPKGHLCPRANGYRR